MHKISFIAIVLGGLILLSCAGGDDDEDRIPEEDDDSDDLMQNDNPPPPAGDDDDVDDDVGGGCQCDAMSCDNLWFNGCDPEVVIIEDPCGIIWMLYDPHNYSLFALKVFNEEACRCATPQEALEITGCENLTQP